MTTISPASGAGTPAPQPAVPSTDYTMFLKLLTTQMQNQDPLKPMDTAEYTQQLVQFSQVEQATQQTGVLKDILSQLNTQQMAQASAFVGREARFDSAVAGLGADPAAWSYHVDGVPASITATIADASGKVIRTVPLDPAAQGRFEWDGVTGDGTRVADGAYTLALNATGAGGETLAATINSIARVTDVMSSGSGVMLGVNGIHMPLNKMIGVSDIR